MNSYRPAWLSVDRPRISTRVAIYVLKAATAAVTCLTGCIIWLSTRQGKQRT